MLRKYVFLCFWAMLLLISNQLSALDLNLYINKGAYSIDDNEFSVCAFNTNEELSSKNYIIRLASDEILNLTVTNTDTLVHSFTIDGILENENFIQAGETINFELNFSNDGTYRYYSDFSYGELAGASGIILVGYDGYPAFYWNLFDLNKDLSTNLASQEITEFPLDYQPELFFMNGTYFPYTLDDAQTLVSVDLNDEVLISVVNSGYMDHVLHFHGFHVEILSAQQQPERIGWIKDTIPLKSGEAMTFRLIASQEGIYPVHDHNLIAVTNVGFYPGGMLTQIHVAQ